VSHTLTTLVYEANVSRETSVPMTNEKVAGDAPAGKHPPLPHVFY
jgi:hypothetical protein